MPERKRSNDGKRETERHVSDAPTPGQHGRRDGYLERKVGTRDDLKQARHGDVTTRVRRSDEKDNDDG